MRGVWPERIAPRVRDLWLCRLLRVAADARHAPLAGDRASGHPVAPLSERWFTRCYACNDYLY